MKRDSVIGEVSVPLSVIRVEGADAATLIVHAERWRARVGAWRLLVVAFDAGWRNNGTADTNAVIVVRVTWCVGFGGDGDRSCSK